jgi:CheY-like chemotaxis protein
VRRTLAASISILPVSTFEKDLPLCDTQESMQSGFPTGSEDGAPRKRLLLIEDNPDIGETLRELLQLLGHQVDLASDGLRGVELALATQPDVALVDIGLPGIDGYEVARRLRASEKGQGVLLVALTGYGRPEDRRQALEAGFDAHMVKPVDPEELSLLISRLSPRKQLQ